MIVAVDTAPRRAAFAALVQGVPFFGALLGTELVLWAHTPDAPIRLYLVQAAPCGAFCAALTIKGHTAALCGTAPDGAELGAFLRFAGVESVLCSARGPEGWRQKAVFYRYVLPANRQLPLPPAPQDEGITLNTHPAMGEVARFLFAAPAEQDCFYTTACTAINHGYGLCHTLEQGGRILTTVGCTARCGGQAYMAAGQTAEALRGRGLGGWLIVRMANELAAAGDEVCFLCAGERRRFYSRLGFTPNGIYKEYIVPMEIQ